MWLLSRMAGGIGYRAIRRCQLLGEAMAVKALTLLVDDQAAGQVPPERTEARYGAVQRQRRS